MHLLKSVIWQQLKSVNCVLKDLLDTSYFGARTHWLIIGIDTSCRQ